MRRAAKVDRNQDEIVAALRAVGAQVQSLAAIGKGVPDLLVNMAGVLYLIEVKDEKQPVSKQKLTEAQIAWHRNWDVHVVNCPQQALWVVGCGWFAPGRAL